MIRLRPLASALCASALALAALAGGVPEVASQPTQTAASGSSRTPVDPSARLPEGDAAAEHWDLALRSESGERLYARFLITNAGPGERSAAAFGHLLLPDGRTQEFRNGRLAGRWQLSDDRRRLQIGSSSLAFDANGRHFEVDNDKRGIKIRVEFPDDASALAGPEAGGYHVDLLNLATPARGQFWLEGMASPEPLEGFALLTHTWFPGSEDRYLRQRLDLVSRAGGSRLFLCEVLPPEGEAWRWGAAGEDGRVERIAGLELTRAQIAPGPYRIPQRLDLGGETIDGSIHLGPPRLEIDPLDALPALVRMVYPLRGHPRHVWVDSTAEVGLKSPTGDAVLRHQGAGIAALFLLDPDPPSER